MDIFQKIRDLNLPPGKYVVFGSAPLAARGLRESHDLDLVVDPDIYEKLKKEGWEEATWASGRKIVRKDVYEVATGWEYGNYRPDRETLIKEADIINGIPFVKLEEVLAWKKEFGRDKDLRDIQIIQEYLSKNPH